ncbi:secretin N-terminal domain-containing protein, partial [Klebsiella pneumoniae]|uniref:secretin N-terminal domain-containing protein n=1 Tax=Klebsiella pneumoniae TaxID=573 RepID=UPI0035678D09
PADQALQGLVGGTGGGQGSGAAPGAVGASVVAVDSSNSVILRGDASSVARLASVAADLDQQAKNGTEIKVVFLENADATQLLPVLQQLVGQTPDQPQQTQLSRAGSGLTANGGSGGTNRMGAPALSQPIVSQAPASVGGGAANGQPAITTQGGRTAAVVTRFQG